MAKSGAGVINEIDADTMRDISETLISLRNKGKPETDSEIRERIDMYFDACRDHAIRPGIEGLCMSLHISRQTLHNWSNQVGCSAECAESIRQARQYIIAVLENMGLQNKIYPATWIFALKNWAGWKDQPQQIEVVKGIDVPRTREELLRSLDQTLVSQCLESEVDDYEDN